MESAVLRINIVSKIGTQRISAGAARWIRDDNPALTDPFGQGHARHALRQTERDSDIGGCDLFLPRKQRKHGLGAVVEPAQFLRLRRGGRTGELKDLAKQTKVTHWQWASKDELVTLFSETDAGKMAAAKNGIEAKHAKWAEKHLGKSGKTAQPKPVTTPPQTKPQIVPESVTSAAANTFTKKGSEFDDADSAWAEHGKPEKFKYDGKANVGGAHVKEFWIDENGDKWLFKPAGKRADAFVAYGEEAAYKIGRLIDPDAIEVRTIRLNGRTGSIQKWRNDLAAKYDFSSFDVADLTADEIAQVQREHVLDWLISNHDGHSKQFIRAKNGKVYGIDKGQLFKFLGSDKLSVDYHPNGFCGEQEPLYNTLFRAVKQGKVTVDPSVTLRYIREVERISDDYYLSLLRPYVEGRFGTDEAGKRAFCELALAKA